MEDRRLRGKKKRIAKRKRKIIFAICLSFFVVAGVTAVCMLQKDKIFMVLQDTTEEITTEAANERDEVTAAQGEVSQDETLEYLELVGCNSLIDDAFGSWLWERYEAGCVVVLEGIQNGTYEDKLWYEATNKSIHVLRDEYLGYLDSEQSKREHLIYEKECSNEDYISLSFAGDISFANDYAPGQNYNQYGIDGAFSPGVQRCMEEPDIFMLNNEFAYTKGGEPQYAKGYIFRADPSTSSRLQEMGVDIVSIANNHAYDYGATGFLDTLDTLDMADMPYVGGGRNLEDAKNHIVYFIANGMKIGYIAATQVERDLPIYTQPATENNPGVVRCYDPELVNEMIKTAKEQCDFVIVYPHWGTELVNSIQDDQRALAQSFIDSGADLVIGGHAHVLQGAEYYNDVPIFYGLSNFCFSSKVRESCIVNITLSMDGISDICLIPCMESAGITIQCDKGDGNYNHIIDMMNTYSPNMHFDENGYVTKVEQ